MAQPVSSPGLDHAPPLPPTTRHHEPSEPHLRRDGVSGLGDSWAPRAWSTRQPRPFRMPACIHTTHVYVCTLPHAQAARALMGRQRTGGPSYIRMRRTYTCVIHILYTHAAANAPDGASEKHASPALSGGLGDAPSRSHRGQVVRTTGEHRAQMNRVAWG